MCHIKPKQDGFTLLEISISIVIVGLIVAGIIGGGELVERAEERSLYSNVQKMKGYVRTFAAKYNYYPGDMPRGKDYFAGCYADHTKGVIFSSCNGNGDGRVYDVGEAVRVSEHLLLSGIWPEQVMSKPGEIVNNCAKPKLRGGFNIHNLYYKGREYGLGIGYPGEDNVPQNPVVLSVGPFGLFCPANMNAFMTHTEMYHLDKKLDDGLPTTGQIVVATHPTGQHPLPQSCRRSQISAYNLTQTTIECAFHVILK